MIHGILQVDMMSYTMVQISSGRLTQHDLNSAKQVFMGTYLLN